MRLVDADELVKQPPDVCEDAPYTGCFYGYSREVIDNMPTIKAPCWISVEERLPEATQTVLVTDGTNVFLSFTVNDYGTLDFYSPWNITHWMPLPAPPKEESE